MTDDSESVRGLHRELADEFLFYNDKKQWASLLATPLYWQTRGPAFAACAANLPGTKYLVSTDDPAELSSLIPKAFFFADHVLIRHRKLLPPSGVMAIKGVPDEFASFDPLKWFEQRRASGNDAGLSTLPHFRGSPDEDHVRGFVDWFCGPGRSWLQEGCVSYVPNLIPQEVETGLLLEDCNLATPLLEAKVIPQATALLNEQVASAIGQMTIPYLSGADANTLMRFKEDEREAVEKLQTEILCSLAEIKAAVDTPEFSRSVEKVFLELRDKVRDAERAIEHQAQSALWGVLHVELLVLSAEFLFWVGAPAPATIGALSLGAIRLAQELRDGLKERYSLRQNPMYALAKLGRLRDGSK